MGTKPHLTLDETLELLKQQDFNVIVTSSGYRVLAPDGIQTAGFHASSFDAKGRTYLNMMSGLEKIGFDPTRKPRPPKKVKIAATTSVAVDTAQDDAAGESPSPADASAIAAGEFHETVKLTPLARQIYDAIIGEPGLTPRAYAARLEIDGRILSSRAKRLFDLDLIEKTGSTKATRWWLKNGARATADAAGPVRRVQGVPADPVIRFGKLVKRAKKIRTDTDEIFEAMLTAYETQEDELVRLRAKVKRLESILGNAVDAL